MRKKIIAVLCIAALAVPPLCVKADYTENGIKDVVNDAVKWKDENDNPMYSIGTSNSNMYIIALGRLGKEYDYSTYLAGLEGIAAGYGSEHKASDMQRSAMATVCAGGDAQNIGGRDLVGDATYYRDSVSPLGKEGANGYSWALLTLDSMQYEPPEWAVKNRNDIIAELLSRQNIDGSFDDDVYVTASAVTALAPYCETSGAYTITQNQTGWVIDLSPKEAVDKAIDYLSNTQSADGDWGDLIATAMTVIALDTMDIDCNGDERFEARKGTAFDGLMSYQNKDGGFSYDNKKSDGEATSYAICALTSHLRKIQNRATLFNMTVKDTVDFSTSSSNPTTKPSSSNSTAKPSTSTSASASKATTKPTTKPTTKATTKPANTLKPTKTTTPKSSDSPDSTSKPTATPKPTKRPALVGPVEMPGPMQPTDPPEINSGGKKSENNNGGIAPVIAVGIVALLALAAFITLVYMNKSGKLTSNGLLSKIIGNKNKKDERYKAKKHRKTEIHRRFDEREKYKVRKKYNKRRR